MFCQDKGAELHCLDPSGMSYGHWGCAAGKAKSNAKTELEKIKIQEMTCAELVKEAAKIIYMVHNYVKDKIYKLEPPCNLMSGVSSTQLA